MRLPLLAAAAFALIAHAAAAQTPPTAAGQALYTANCASCHLATGAGGINFGTVTSADLRAPGLETTYHNSDTLIARAILQGKDQNGQPLNAPMPIWSGRLTPTQAAQIIAYLHTLHS
jgi:mono/diheme cytochrome c family protein